MDPQAPNVPPPEPEEPAVPKTPQVKENSSITTISVAIFILLALGAIVFLYYQNQQLKNMLANYQSQPAVSPTPAATADPTANWKTFTGSDWSFKYPSNLFAKETVTNFVDLVDSENTPASNAKISIDARLIAPYLNNYDTALKRRVSDINIINPQTTTLPNGVIISGKLGPGMGEGLQVTDALIKYKNGAISVQYNDDNVDTQTFNQILSTFKFINPTASPSGIPVVCPQLAKQCPDGSYVSPTGPNCEFAPCPTP